MLARTRPLDSDTEICWSIPAGSFEDGSARLLRHTQTHYGSDNAKHRHPFSHTPSWQPCCIYQVHWVEVPTWILQFTLHYLDQIQNETYSKYPYMLINQVIPNLAIVGAQKSQGCLPSGSWCFSCCQVGNFVISQWVWVLDFIPWPMQMRATRCWEPFSTDFGTGHGKNTFRVAGYTSTLGDEIFFNQSIIAVCRQSFERKFKQLL